MLVPEGSEPDNVLESVNYRVVAPSELGLAIIWWNMRYNNCLPTVVLQSQKFVLEPFKDSSWILERAEYLEVELVAKHRVYSNHPCVLIGSKTISIRVNKVNGVISELEKFLVSLAIFEKSLPRWNPRVDNFISCFFVKLVLVSWIAIMVSENWVDGYTSQSVLYDLRCFNHGILNFLWR